MVAKRELTVIKMSVFFIAHDGPISTFCFVDENLIVTTQMKATEQYFPLELWYSVYDRATVLTFGHSNQSHKLLH